MILAFTLIAAAYFLPPAIERVLNWLAKRRGWDSVPPVQSSDLIR